MIFFILQTYFLSKVLPSSCIDHKLLQLSKFKAKIFKISTVFPEFGENYRLPIGLKTVFRPNNEINISYLFVTLKLIV